jgi:DNA mismatch endonuclease (patch repair protein)
MFKMPGTRTDFWEHKIEQNRLRDASALKKLVHDNWRVLTVWECSLTGAARREPEEMTRLCHKFLLGKRGVQEIGGCWN